MKKLLAIVLSLCYCFLAMAQVGTWRNYLAYHDVQSICKANDNLFVLASNDLYQYNLNDQSITTYDKVNGLSDTHITYIAWSQKAKRLIAVYEDSNIDLIDIDGNIINISALYNKAMTEDKTITGISIDGVYAYLTTSFAIIKVNIQKAEISETYTNNNPEYPKDLIPYKDDYDTYISTVSTLNPGGPAYNRFYESKYINGRLYTTGGFFLPAMPDNAIPGTIQAENYDKGGEGYSYHDTKPENEGDASFRTDEGVDIVKGNGGKAVGYTAVDEWLEYTVNVTQAGKYTCEAVVSAGGTGSKFTVQRVKGNSKTNLCTIDVPQTGNNDWGTYKTVTKDISTSLSAGEQVFRITITGANCNIDKLVFKLTQDTGINDVDNDAEQTGIDYNLSGQEVDAGYRGIIIRNGRKILKK